MEDGRVLLLLISMIRKPSNGTHGTSLILESLFYDGCVEQVERIVLHGFRSGETVTSFRTARLSPALQVFLSKLVPSKLF